MKTWLRRRGALVTITSGKIAGLCGTVEANVQRAVDYPDGLANGYHVILVTVRLDQMGRLQPFQW